VWVAEKDSQPGERPSWASVFVGKRNGNYVSGTFADVRKGVSITASGNATMTVGADRTLRIADGTDRTRILTPDYALDFGRMAETVRARISGRVVGYGLAIAAHGIVVTRASGGLRLLSVDGGSRPFTNDTQNSADSTSKLVTAAAVMKALDERNISVDAKVGPYLPSCWKTVRKAAGLTFRDLLAHTSLLYKPPRIDCDENPLLCLQKSIERGPQPERDGTKDGYDYENINYGMFRALLPLVTAPEKVKSEFTKANCNTANGRLNAIVSNRFAAYVLILLKNLDVVAGFGPSSGNRAYRYNFANQGLPGIQTYATYLESGAGGLWISAPEYVQFLSALDRGAVVDQDVLAVMKSGRLGFERGCSLKDALGSCYAKNGSGTDAQGRGSESQAVMFPGDVQVFLTINSRTNAYRGDRRDVLIAAFHTALR
jgi:CubicO group peptidase (beta-lactamase class C family)